MKAQRIVLPATDRTIGANVLALARSVYVAARVSTLGFTLLLPLIGAAFSSGALALTDAGALIAVACCYHLFAYMLNDVADLWVDRSEPLRADSLLVRGVMSPRQATWMVCAQVPLAFALAVAAGMPGAALGWLAAAFAGIALYDLYGKRCPLALVSDMVQAAGWCALVLFGAASLGNVAWPALWAPLLYVFLYVLMINGIHGGLRDLANDHAAGARTTAIGLGARAHADGGVWIPQRLGVYALALQTGLCVAGAAAIPSGPAPQVLTAQVLVAGALGASTWLLVRAARRRHDRRELIAAGVAQMVVALAVLPLACLPLLDAGAIVLMFAVFALPAAAMYLYNGTRWCL